MEFQKKKRKRMKVFFWAALYLQFHPGLRPCLAGRLKSLPADWTSSLGPLLEATGGFNVGLNFK